MVCDKCGTQYENAKFCPECGTPAKGYAPVQQPELPYQQWQPPVIQKKKSKKGFIIAAIIVGAIILIVILVSILNGGNGNSNNTNNFTNNSGNNTSSENNFTNNNSGNNTSSENNAISQAEIIQRGTFTTIDDICQFKVDFSKIATRIDPPQASGYYTYYEIKDKSNTYIDICIAYKNLENSDKEADEIGEIKLYYDNKYEYDGFSCIEEDGRSDFTYSSITSISPLTTGYVHFLFEVPKEITTSNKSIIANIKFGDKEFRYIVK